MPHRAKAPETTSEQTMIPFSVLDLSPVTAGATPADAFRNTLDLAQHAESWDYRRFWLAEHHNMTGIASAATSVVIGHVAGGTKTIRVGSGGIMLPNHAPLVIAEQFGTLASLYPGPHRPGPRPRARHRSEHRSRAAPRSAKQRGLVSRRRGRIAALFRRPRAGPAHSRGAGRGAERAAVAARLDRCSARNSRPRSVCRSRSRRTSRPTTCCTALQVYRAQFRPSATLDKPYAMVGVNLFAADTQRRSAASFHLAAAAVHQSAARHAGSVAAAGRAASRRRRWS